MKEKGGTDSKRMRRLFKRVHDSEYEAMDLAERLYEYGHAAEGR